MDAALVLFLMVVGAFVGFLSGLLGIGGGIVMFPLLLYVPTSLGIPEIGVKAITGLTMGQGFFAAVTALYQYQRNALVSRPLVITLGMSLFLSSLTGSLFSTHLSDRVLLMVFGSLALIAAAMMFVPRNSSNDERKADQVTFSRTLAVALGLVLGFTIGLVGQGGAFILIPTMLYVLRIPLRVALGSTLAIGLFSSTAGLIGKTVTGQVPYLSLLPLLAGAIPAARWGSIVGMRTDTRTLKRLLAFVICATAIKIWGSLL